MSTHFLISFVFFNLKINKYKIGKTNSAVAKMLISQFEYPVTFPPGRAINIPENPSMILIGHSKCFDFFRSPIPIRYPCNELEIRIIPITAEKKTIKISYIEPLPINAGLRTKKKGITFSSQYGQKTLW